MGHKIGGYKGAAQLTEYYQSSTPIDVKSDVSSVLLFQLNSDYAMVIFLRPVNTIGLRLCGEILVLEISRLSEKI